MGNGDTSAALKEFDGWAALSHSVQFLRIHVLVALLATVVFWLAMLMTAERTQWAGSWRRKLRLAFSDFAYVFGFAMFGVVTAFFLSLGLKRGASGESTNGLIEGFAAPFIALLTGGLVFVTSSRVAGRDKPSRVAICVACFLCSAAVSYRTFFYQILTAF